MEMCLVTVAETQNLVIQTRDKINADVGSILLRSEIVDEISANHDLTLVDTLSSRVQSVSKRCFNSQTLIVVLQ